MGDDAQPSFVVMPLKILQLVSNPSAGGTETFVMGLVPELRRLGVDVTLANLWDEGGDMSRVCRILGLECVLLNVGRGFFRPSAPWKLRRYLKEQKFDLVMAYGLRTTLLLRISALFRGRPVLATGLRGLDLWRKWHHIWLDRLTERLMDYYIGVSRAVCIKRVEREKTTARKVLLIPNGIDTNYFRPDAAEWPERKALGLPNGRLCVSVGYLRPQKGYPFQLDVIAAIEDLPPDIRFVWVGSGDDEAMLRDLVEAKGLVDRVMFYGNTDDVRPILAHAELFFMSSREEGMPRALMEAMAMGLPVLTTDVGGNREVVRDELDGLVVRFGDVPGSARSLKRLLEDPELRQRLCAAGKKRINEHFSFAHIANRYVELYQRLVDGDKTVINDFGFA